MSPSLPGELQEGYVLVRHALRNFRKKSGFHECPKCKSRSVWRTDPLGALEETLHFLLRVSPYRCARCDNRFMDSKVVRPSDEPTRTSRWLAYVRAKFGLTPRERPAFANSLNLKSILPPPTANRDVAIAESEERFTRA